MPGVDRSEIHPQTAPPAAPRTLCRLLVDEQQASCVMFSGESRTCYRLINGPVIVVLISRAVGVLVKMFKLVLANVEYVVYF